MKYYLTYYLKQYNKAHLINIVNVMNIVNQNRSKPKKIICLYAPNSTDKTIKTLFILVLQHYNNWFNITQQLLQCNTKLWLIYNQYHKMKYNIKYLHYMNSSFKYYLIYLVRHNKNNFGAIYSDEFDEIYLVKYHLIYY